MRPRLIVNADDFGFSPGVNAAVREAHLGGVLTSATLLANAPGFDEAVRLAAALPRLGVGLHLNLVRGRPLSPPSDVPELTAPDGRFRPFRLRRLTPAFLRDAETEYRRQFEKILAAGIQPTHIDFEKHHAWQGKLYDLARGLAREYGVTAVRNLREPAAWAVRRLGWPGFRRFGMAAALRCAETLFGGRAPDMRRPDRLLGGTHIGGMTEAVWLRLAKAIPPGTSEAMVHPSLPDMPGVPEASGMGASWLAGREEEFRALVSPRVWEALERAGVELIDFRALGDAPGRTV